MLESTYFERPRTSPHGTLRMASQFSDLGSNPDPCECALSQMCHKALVQC